MGARGGFAERLSRAANGDIRADNTVMTRCLPDDGAWSVEGKQVDIGAGSRYGEVRDAVLRVAGVPVMYTPYLRFPTTDERQSGFLFPSFGFSDEDGTDIAVPYYFNLAPNYDATVTPRYLSERGAMLEVEGRHLARGKGQFADTVIGGAFLASDDLYDGNLSRDEFEEAGLSGRFRPDDRWLASIQHQGRIGDFRTLIDYTEVSDLDYFRDLGTNLEVTSQSETQSATGN